MKRSISVVTFAALSAVLTAGAAEFDIGTCGAQITLDDSWERQMLNADLGADQFVSRKGLFTIINELEGLFERRQDFESRLDVMVSSIEVRTGAVDEDSGTLFQSRDGVGCGTRRLKVRYGGLLLAYQIDVVGRDGLGYMIMTWGPASAETDVHDWASRTARSVSFPGPDTQWGRQAVAASRPVRFGAWTVNLSYRESVFSEYPPDGTDRFTMVTAEEDVAVHVFINEMDVDTERALESVIELVREDGGTSEEIYRSDVETAAGSGREVLVRHVETGDDYDVAVVVVELEEGRFLDVRMVSAGQEQHREELWRRLVDSMTVTPPKLLDAFPVVDREAEASTTLNPASRALLEASEIVGSVEGWNATFRVGPAGGVIARMGRRIVAVDPGKDQPVPLYSFQEWHSDPILEISGDAVLTADAESNVARVVDRKLEPLGFVAHALAAAGDSRLVLVRSPEAPSLLGLGHLPVVDPVAVILREGDEERVLAELNGVSVTGLAASGLGDRALLVTQTEIPFSSEVGDELYRLMDLDLSSGEASVHSAWTWVSAVAAAGSGWLVSGTPEEGVSGLYLVGGSGDQELLVSGGATGIGLDAETLIFASDLQLEEDPDGPHEIVVYRAPMDVVRIHGPRCQPLVTGTVNRIADDTRTALEGGESRFRPLASVATIRRHLAEADVVCQGLAGVPLPSAPDAIDQLVADLAFDDSLTDESQVLLAAMVTAALVDGGATWVESDGQSARGRGTSGGWIADNAYAVALDPAEVTNGALHDEDGWWHPVSSLVEAASGRKLVVGTDHERLRERVAELVSPELVTAVEQGKRRRIARLLGERPDNSYLRDRVYRQLAARGELETVVEVAADFVTVADPAPEDLKAWLSARLALAAEDGEAAGLVADLRSAIVSQPDEPAFYLLLGKTYEMGDGDERDEFARACFLKTVELISWGPLAVSAQEALKALDEGEKD